MNSDFSDFIRFFPIFRLFPTSRLSDSTALIRTAGTVIVMRLKRERKMIRMAIMMVMARRMMMARRKKKKRK